MKGDRISRLILVLEIVLIVLLHIKKSNTPDNSNSPAQESTMNAPVPNIMTANTVK
jgi:hypothetical protein